MSKVNVSFALSLAVVLGLACGDNGSKPDGAAGGQSGATAAGGALGSGGSGSGGSGVGGIAAGGGGGGGQPGTGGSGAGGKTGTGGSTSAGGRGGSSAGTGGLGAGGSGSGGTSGRGGSGGNAIDGGSAAGAGGGGGSTMDPWDGGQGGVDGSAASDGGDAPAVDDRPILERPVRPEWTCMVTRPFEKLDLGWSGADLAATASGVFLAYGGLDDSGTEATMLSSIGADGKRGADKLLSQGGTSYRATPRLRAGGRGLSVAWAEADSANQARLMIAELDAAGNVTLAPTAIGGLTGRIEDPDVAPTQDGSALLFSQAATDNAWRRVSFVRLDTSAKVVAGPVTVAERVGSGSIQAGALVAVPGGFAATYRSWSSIEAKSYLVFLDNSGAKSGEPIVLGASRQSIGQSLLVRGGELVVAYVDEQGVQNYADIAGTILVARFDSATRARSRPDVRLKQPVVDQEIVDPRLVAIGDDIGLVWSRGGVIYICGGCMPDNHLEFVLMDGDDLTPLAPLVTLENREANGGFIRPAIAAAGDQLLVASTLMYHVAGEGASAAIRCTLGP